MSATGRTRADGTKSERIEADAYLTAPDLAYACAALLEVAPGMRALEPSAGEGSFVQGLHRAHGLVATAVDRRRAVQASLKRCLGDELEVPTRITRFEDIVEPETFDLVLGNPPYKKAQEHIEHAMYLLRPMGILGFLLRLNFLSSKGRFSFFQRLPPWRVYVLVDRPDFTGEGGDATEYAFFVWRKGLVGAPRLDWFRHEDPVSRDEDIARIRRCDWQQAA